MLRERNEKIAFAQMLVDAITWGQGISARDRLEIIEDYVEEVTQVRYNLGYQPAWQRRLQHRAQEEKLLASTMARLDAMTVPDEEL